MYGFVPLVIRLPVLMDGGSDAHLTLLLVSLIIETRAGFSWWEAWGPARGVTLV